MTSSPSDDQRFLELLQRWQSGDFTRQDEQTLRQLTESDDFRREAMEGFLAWPEADHADRISVLRNRLQTARPRSRLLALPQMMAIAAALLVLVVAVWFFPRASEKATAPTAQTQAPVLSPAPVDAAPSIAATESAAGDAVARSTPGIRREEAPRKQALDQKAPSYAGSGVADQQIVAAEAKDDERLSSEQAPAATMAAPPVAQPSTPPGAEPLPARKAKATMAKPAPVAADTSQLAWNETEKKSDLDKLRKEVRADKAGPLRSEPAEGWEAFNEYLRQSARLPPEARDHNVSGSVRLRFSVNVNGDPQNFVVLHSLGFGCDEEAKRLVQNWAWLRGQQAEVTVEVKFVR